MLCAFDSMRRGRGGRRVPPALTKLEVLPWLSFCGVDSRDTVAERDTADSRASAGDGVPGRDGVPLRGRRDEADDDGGCTTRSGFVGDGERVAPAPFGVRVGGVLVTGVNDVLGRFVTRSLVAGVVGLLLLSPSLPDPSVSPPAPSASSSFLSSSVSESKTISRGAGRFPFAPRLPYTRCGGRDGDDE